MANQQWGPPSGPYPPQGPGGGQYPPPQGPPRGQQPPPQGYPQQGGPYGPPQGYPQQPQQFGQPNQGFGWGPQFGGPGSGMPPGGMPPGGMPPGGMPPGGPPPPKRNGLLVALIMVGVLVIGVAVVAGLRSGKDDVTSNPPIPTKAASPTPTGTTSTDPTIAPPSDPTTAPTTTTTTTTTVPKPTRTTTRVPPPRKTPPRKPKVSDLTIVSRNRVYFTGTMNSMGCREPRARPSSGAGAASYYAGLFSCLNRAWPRQVRAAGNTFRAPRVMHITGPTSSPCGTGGSSVSFYCSANETIYMKYDDDVRNYNRYSQNYQKVWARMWAMHTVAHEYGHHVQAITGIIQAAHNLRYEASSRALELELTRRTELQASCFANMFIGAHRRSLPISGESRRQYEWAVTHTIDPRRDHGSTKNHGFWAMRAFNSRNASQCNTFTASSRVVS